jgi:hypothetical protein
MRGTGEGEFPFSAWSSPAHPAKPTATVIATTLISRPVHFIKGGVFGFELEDRQQQIASLQVQP